MMRAQVLQQSILLLRHGDRGPISRSAGRLECNTAFWESRLPGDADIREWDARFPVDGPSHTIDHDDAPFGMLT